MKDSRNFENNLVKLIAALGFLLIAYFAIQVFFGAYTNKLIQNFSGPALAMDQQFREQISGQTDAYAACKLGLNFQKANKDDLALLAFQKATDLDLSYRDGWVLRGYEELENNQPETAITSLKRAEDLDPINPRTYELLEIAYNRTGDEDGAKKAREKYEYLSKNR